MRIILTWAKKTKPGGFRHFLVIFATGENNQKIDGLAKSPNANDSHSRSPVKKNVVPRAEPVARFEIHFLISPSGLTKPVKIIKHKISYSPLSIPFNFSRPMDLENVSIAR